MTGVPQPIIGLLAQVRIGNRGTGILISPEPLVRGFDAVLRRATSLSRFVIRAETLAARREVVLWIAAVRRDETDRADSSVLLLLRRALPEIQRRKWVQIPADTRGFKTESVFADYELLSQCTAEKEMQRLEALKCSSDTGATMLATTELPPPPVN